MRKNLDWSILIWSIFLVISISFSFLYISNQISKNIDKNRQKISEMQNSNILDNFSFDSKSKNIENNETLEIKYFRNFSTNLAENKTLNIEFLTSNTWGITISNWWVVFYTVYSGSTIYSSWLITDSKYDIILNQSSNLSIENLWWLAKINLDFDSNTGVVYPYNYLTIKKSIWGSDIIKSIVKIK